MLYAAATICYGVRRMAYADSVSVGRWEPIEASAIGRFTNRRTILRF